MVAEKRRVKKRRGEGEIECSLNGMLRRMETTITSMLLLLLLSPVYLGQSMRRRRISWTVRMSIRSSTCSTGSSAVQAEGLSKAASEA